MEAHSDSRFGVLAVKNGFASESDVQFALDTQRDSSGEGIAPPLGEILLEMGMLTRERLNALVVEQNVLRSGVVDSPIPVKHAPAAAAPSTEGATPGPGRRILGLIGGKLGRVFRNVTGKTAKEKALESERRDGLLCRIAEGSLLANAEGADAVAARKAKAALDAARQKAAAAVPGRAALAASAGVKVAETKVKLALVRLGRGVVDRGGAPPDLEALAAEVRALDAKIAELG